MELELLNCIVGPMLFAPGGDRPLAQAVRNPAAEAGFGSQDVQHSVNSEGLASPRFDTV